MSKTIRFETLKTDLDALATHTGRIAVFAAPDAPQSAPLRRINRLTRGALTRLLASHAFADLAPGAALEMAYPAGMAADALQVVHLPRRASVEIARKAGAALGKAHGEAPLLVVAGSHPQTAEVALGLALRAYDYTAQKSSPGPAQGEVRFMLNSPGAIDTALEAQAQRAAAVHLTRDLVNAPANLLTTESFAAQLQQFEALGLKVEVLDEAVLEQLGMRALLAVGQGSQSPSKLVVMHWQGGGDASPLAIVGKGVMFDTGGISMKPAAGMETMTMDMGGAAVTAGVMQALALRKARANVVGLVGLVENMPDGRAQRPGDVVRSMKGDTIEVINTDAEGRMVLADVLWYAQERFNPAAVIDLATLTGAIIIALGHGKAGVFANDDTLCEAFLKAAKAEGEGAWRMPLDPACDEQIKSRIADVKNSGGRPAGAITAARFLQRFIRPGMAWMHIDIAGVALRDKDSALAPKGATGWGVLALDRLVRDRFEP